MNMNVLLEDSFDGHQGHDLFDMEHQTPFRVFKIRKNHKVEDILILLAETFVSLCRTTSDPNSM